MPSLNKVFIAGNLTRDVELRYTPGGAAVAGFGVGVNRKYKGRDEQWKTESVFVDIEVWGKTAENCAEYLGKGSQVVLEGRLKLDEWEDKKSGQKRSKLKVVGENVQFVGEKRGGQTQQNPGRGPQSHVDELPDTDDVPF
jgi:single-strand DNA-binding protein